MVGVRKLLKMIKLNKEEIKVLEYLRLSGIERNIEQIERYTKLDIYTIRNSLVSLLNKDLIYVKEIKNKRMYKYKIDGRYYG